MESFHFFQNAIHLLSSLTMSKQTQVPTFFIPASHEQWTYYSFSIYCISSSR